MLNPLVSVVISSIRPEFWMRLYNSLLNNKVPFEIVVAGPSSPKFDLPNNIRYIKTNVKPAQCFHCGVLSSQGEYILHTADDYVFSEGAIDKLYKKFKNCDNEIKFSTGKISTNFLNKKRKNIKTKSFMSTHFFGKFSGKYVENNLYCPILPNGSGAFYHKSIYDKLGGVDRNFIAAYFDLDFVMRIYEAGGISLFCEDVIFTEMKGKSKLPASCSRMDALFFTSLWCDLLDKEDRHASYKKYDEKFIKCKNKDFPIIECFSNGTLNPIVYDKKDIAACKIRVRKERKISVDKYELKDVFKKSQGTNSKLRWD